MTSENNESSAQAKIEISMKGEADQREIVNASIEA